MSGTLLPRLIEFVLQTAILLGLLWGMIKIQKLDQHATYRFLWVLGAAALATGSASKLAKIESIGRP